jgi:beta-phosphoglucomutase-like phosphatase (HAD superfamily)
MNQPDAAIFDMDGVLVDTYQAHYRSWPEMARGEGLDFINNSRRRRITGKMGGVSGRSFRKVAV